MQHTFTCAPNINNNRIRKMQLHFQPKHFVFNVSFGLCCSFDLIFGCCRLMNFFLYSLCCCWSFDGFGTVIIVFFFCCSVFWQFSVVFIFFISLCRIVFGLRSDIIARFDFFFFLISRIELNMCRFRRHLHYFQTVGRIDAKESPTTTRNARKFNVILRCGPYLCLFWFSGQPSRKLYVFISTEVRFYIINCNHHLVGILPFHVNFLTKSC